MKDSFHRGEDPMAKETAARGLLGVLGVAPLESGFPGQEAWQSLLDRNSGVQELPEYKQLVQERKDGVITTEVFREKWIALLQKVSVDEGLLQTVIPKTG